MLLLQNELFYCSHINKHDFDEIQKFSVKHKEGEGLVKYLKGLAIPDELEGNMRTYLVRDNFSNEIAGYFSLKAGLMSINESKDNAYFDTLPGIELANFAVNHSYVLKHPGVENLGMIFFNDFILQIVDDVAHSIGARILYIFALPYDELIKHYKKYGFNRLKSTQEKQLHKRLKNVYDSECIFMYKPI